MFRLDKLRCDEMQPLISLMQFIFAFDFKTALASIRKKHIGERAGLTRSVDLSDMSTGKIAVPKTRSLLINEHGRVNAAQSSAKP
jgi:hypothetical protein